MHQLPTNGGDTTLTVAKRGQVVSAALEKVPVEAVMRVVDLVADIVKANKIMEGRSQEFEHKLTLLREGNLDRKERMSMLSNLLLQLEFSEETQIRLVESICRIAEGV
jgi:hypothetical protein